MSLSDKITDDEAQRIAGHVRWGFRLAIGVYVGAVLLGFALSRIL